MNAEHLHAFCGYKFYILSPLFRVGQAAHLPGDCEDWDPWPSSLFGLGSQTLRAFGSVEDERLLREAKFASACRAAVFGRGRAAGLEGAGLGQSPGAGPSSKSPGARVKSKPARR